MYKGYKIVVNTAAGRRRYMQYLIPFVVTCDIVDRYDLWLNTMNKQDIAFFVRLADKYPKINLVWQPDGIVNGNSTINAFYKDCIEVKTIYFKLDDDIIWMEPDLIEKMVAFRVDNPEYFLVSPLVINNSLSTYLLQVCDRLKLDKYYQSFASHEVLWKSGKFALDLHNWFYENYLKTNRYAELYLGKHPMGMTRFSINAILWFGDEMKKIQGHVPGDDEEFLSCIYPTKSGMENCWNGNAIVSHFAFFTQRESLDKESVLEKYGELLNNKWRNDSRYKEIHESVQEAMTFVEKHIDELPDAPYQKLSANKSSISIKNITKGWLPYIIYKRIVEYRLNHHDYIII